MEKIDSNSSITQIQHLLVKLDWIRKEQVLNIEVPGEGNMNVVLRVFTNKRSFILKQSRPFVQKYQQIPAPIERINTEYQFYKATADEKLQRHLPKVLAYDSSNYLMMLEDLGQCEDMTRMYETREIADHDLKKLLEIACQIHQKAIPANYPLNMDLRKLNHAHLFVLPFALDNQFELDDIQVGLQELSIPYKRDRQLKAVIKQLGERYLSTGDVLLHGDYYPGSWMRTSDQVFVMDPEFSFIGFKEYDIGVMAGHIIMATLNTGYLKRICELYQGSFDANLVNQITGMEIMRRLIGLGQLPLERSLDEKDSLLKVAKELVLA